MKWIAGLVGLTLYVIWPYYTLIEFGQAIQSRDSRTINSMVDWSTLRANVKAQLQEGKPCRTQRRSRETRPLRLWETLSP